MIFLGFLGISGSPEFQTDTLPKSEVAFRPNEPSGAETGETFCGVESREQPHRKKPNGCCLQQSCYVLEMQHIASRSQCAASMSSRTRCDLGAALEVQYFQHIVLAALRLRG